VTVGNRSIPDTKTAGRAACGRGTVRGTGRLIIPALRVPSDSRQARYGSCGLLPLTGLRGVRRSQDVRTVQARAFGPGRPSSAPRSLTIVCEVIEGAGPHQPPGNRSRDGKAERPDGNRAERRPQGPDPGNAGEGRPPRRPSLAGGNAVRRAWPRSGCRTGIDSVRSIWNALCGTMSGTACGWFWGRAGWAGRPVPLPRMRNALDPAIGRTRGSALALLLSAQRRSLSEVVRAPRAS
jgi:hypothetical protein